MPVTAMKQKPLRDPAEVPLPPLAADPRYRAAREELAALERRFEAAEKRELIAKARQRGQQPTRPAVDRARDLVAGGAVIASTPQAELEAAAEEQTILRAAIAAQQDKLNAIAGEISLEVCKQLAPLAADALRNALDAATALHQALEAGRVLRSRLITGGYQVNETTLPVHVFPHGAQLGDPDRIGLTPAALFKTWLRDRGIV